MSSTLDSDVLIAEYKDKIRSWDWPSITDEFEINSTDEDCYEDDGNGRRFVYFWMGTVFGLTPSGKVYAFWTTNQTDEDVIRDSAWWEALDNIAEEHGCFVGSPDGAACDDIFLCKRFDTPEEDDEDDDSFS